MLNMVKKMPQTDTNLIQHHKINVLIISSIHAHVDNKKQETKKWHLLYHQCMKYTESSLIYAPLQNVPTYFEKQKNSWLKKWW